MRRHRNPRDDFPGTGAEFAEHLARVCKLNRVTVIEDDSDYYNSETREVALSPENFSGKSLTAVVIAAHEIGHALQHKQGYLPLRLRHRMAGIASVAERLGLTILLLGPILGLMSGSPLIFRLMVIAVIFSFLTSILLHLITLPVEFNASFSVALPILKEGGYIETSDYRAAHSLLLAAALTYVAASLWSILDFARWAAILRR